MALGRELAIGVEKCLSEIGSTETLEVHREEADVVQHVSPSQPVVELEAVEDTGAVVEAVGVVRQEIAVAVEDSTAGDAIQQQRVAAVDVLMREDADLVQRLGVERARHEDLHLSEVLLPEVRQRVGCSDRSDLVEVRASAWAMAMSRAI